MNIKKKVFGVVLSAVMLLSVAGVGTASAAISKNVGGGIWSYSLEPVRVVTSQYYHATKKHGSSVQIGKNKPLRDCAKAGGTSFAKLSGMSGTRYAYWHNYCTHI